MLFDVTILQTVPADEGKNQVLEVKALVNSEHLTLIEPRTQGGSIISFPQGGKMVIKETKSEIKKALGMTPLKPAVKAKKK